MISADDQPPQFLDERKSLACIHCGLCLGSCPTYLETGNENESPRGRIYVMRALQQGRLPLERESIRHIDLCLGCRACEAACPSGVQYGVLLEQTRDFIERNYRRTWWERLLRRFVIEKIFPVPWRMYLALFPARVARGLGMDRWLPRSLRDSLKLLPATFSSGSLPELIPSAVQPAKGRIGFVQGCVMQTMFAATNRSSARLLALAGYDVIVPKDQACCGALFAHGGNLEQAREHAKKNIDAFKNLKLDAIVINAAGCGSTLKEYAHMLKGDPIHGQAAEDFTRQVRDLTEFLVSIGFQNRVFQREAKKVTYHDACHLAHPQRITRPPRDLVRAVAGENYVELPEADVCCGSAGSYNLLEPEMADRLQKRKIGNIISTGAQVLVTTNPGCMLQVEAGLRKAGCLIEVIHISDFLLAALEGKTSIPGKR